MERKNDKTLFSIIIPTYNHAQFINRCLDSVLAQTYPNWEVIVVNNYSEDNTIELVNGYNDKRIRLINFHNNGVIAVSRNVGIKAAKGEWICFLDSDDWWASNKLQFCFKRINVNVDFIYHNLVIVRDKPVLFGKKRTSGRKLVNPVLVDLLIKGNCINNSSVVVRKSLLERINGINEDPKMIASEDYNTWLRIAQITDKFDYISESLGFYLLQGQSISQKDMSYSTRCACAEFIDVLNESQRNRYESVIFYMSGKYDYSNQLFEKARYKLLHSLRYGSALVRLKSLFFIICSFAKSVYFK